MTQQQKVTEQTLKKIEELQELISKEAHPIPTWNQNRAWESFHPILPENHTTYAMPKAS